MTESEGSSGRSSTELFYGSLDIMGLFLNVVCLLVLRKFTKLFHNELFILIGSLIFLSIFGCAMLVFKIFKTYNQSSFDYIGLASLAVPISYNLFLPAILSKGAQQLAPDRGHHFTCSYLYGAVCLSLIIFFVMVISPMPGMDYHKFQQPVHAPHPGLHTSVATPLLMITGSFPQVFSILLSLHQIERISGNILCCKSGSSSSSDNSNGVKNSSYENDLLNKYFRRWGLCTVLLVVPSALISILGFFLWRGNQKLPAFVGFCHAFCDTALFSTQPLALIVLWMAYKIHQMNEKLDHKLYQKRLIYSTTQQMPEKAAASLIAGSQSQVVSLNHHAGTISSSSPQSPGQGTPNTLTLPTHTSQIIPVIPLTITPTDIQDPTGRIFGDHSMEHIRKSNSATGSFPNGGALSPQHLQQQHQHKRSGEDLDVTSVDINLGKTCSSYNLKWTQQSAPEVESPAPSPTVSLTYLQSEV